MGWLRRNTSDESNKIDEVIKNRLLSIMTARDLLGIDDVLIIRHVMAGEGVWCGLLFRVCY